MSDEVKRQCAGITRRDRQCRRWAKAGSDFCGLHDGSRTGVGAPAGNVNAKTHGFYSDFYTTLELQDLAVVAAVQGLEDEIGLLRIRIRRALREGAELDAIGRACGRLTQMLKAQRMLTGESANEFERALNEVLASVTEELGLSLS